VWENETGLVWSGVANGSDVRYDESLHFATVKLSALISCRKKNFQEHIFTKNIVTGWVQAEEFGRHR